MTGIENLVVKFERVVFDTWDWTYDAARITKRDTEMFLDESWKPVYFGGQRVKSKGHKKQKHRCKFSSL